MNERLVNLGILAGTLVVAIAVGEIAVRKFGRVVMAPSRETTDSLVSYRLKPNVKGRAVQPGIMDYRWTTNAQQLRATREYSQRKPAGVKRVAAIGDSFTFGVGVNDHETYPAVLDSLLNARCADSVEVMNFGVGGHGLSQEVEMYERYARPFEPDVVIYGFMLNDIADNLQFPLHKLVGDSAVLKPLDERPKLMAAKRITEAIPGYGWLITHSALFNGARQVYFVLHRKRTAGGAQVVNDTSARTKQDLTSPQWKLQRALLKRMQSSVEAQGARFVVLLFADNVAAQAYYKGEPERAAILVGMRQLCEELALRCVSFGEWLVQNAPNARVDKLYIPVDAHLTAAGNRLAARTIEGPVRELLGCPAETPASLPAQSSDAGAALTGRQSRTPG